MSCLGPLDKTVGKEHGVFNGDGNQLSRLLGSILGFTPLNGLPHIIEYNRRTPGLSTSVECSVTSEMCGTLKTFIRKVPLT